MIKGEAEYVARHCRAQFANALHFRMIDSMAELPKRYDPKAVEPKWYQRWLENRDFVADPESSKPAFSIPALAD